MVALSVAGRALVTIGALNLRAGPSTGCLVIATLELGTHTNSG